MNFGGINLAQNHLHCLGLFGDDSWVTIDLNQQQRCHVARQTNPYVVFDTVDGGLIHYF